MEMSLCFFPFSIKTSKCSGSCNNINNLYAKICGPDVKNVNVKVFNPMSKTNETRHIEWHKTCKCECKFGANVSDNKQRLNKSKCRCECKELIDKKVCNKGFGILVTVSLNVIKLLMLMNIYLDYENCKCRKKLVAPLIEECTETVKEVKLAKITLAKNENSCKFSSCTVYTVLFWVFCLLKLVFD